MKCNCSTYARHGICYHTGYEPVYRDPVHRTDLGIACEIRVHKIIKNMAEDILLATEKEILMAMKIREWNRTVNQ